MNTEYGLHVSEELQKRLHRCRAPVRDAIRERLQQIALGAGKGGRRVRTLAPSEPPLRFYVYEGFRIVYQLDGGKRRVVVLAIEPLPID